jgi:hypothetical protein
MNEELLKYLNLLIDKRLQNKLSIPVQVAQVKSVDKDKCSCDVQLIDGAELFNVNLRSVLDDNKKGFVCFPKMDSLVLVGTIGNNENNAFVLIFSELTDITIDAKIVINDGENKGMVKIEPTIEKLNAIENKINDLIEVFTSWTPVAQDGGAALKSALSSWITQQLQTTEIVDLENENVKH